MTTYAELDTMLHFKQDVTKRRLDKRKLTGTTWLERLTNTTIGIRLHDTYIMEFYEDGSIVLDCGGWATVTTQARMNDYLLSRWYVRRMGAKDNKRLMLSDREQGEIVATI